VSDGRLFQRPEGCGGVNCRRQRADADMIAASSVVSPKTVTLKIDGKSITVPEGTSVYDAARMNGIYIPVLCHKENLTPVGVCRACVCDVTGGRVYAAACMRAVEQGMEVSTSNLKLDQTRATIVEMLLSDHPHPCAKHKEDRSCELELIAEMMGFREPIYTPRAATKGTDFSNPSIAIDHSACIVCDRCVRACTDVAHNEVIGRMGKGYTTSISFDDNKPMGTSSCVNCGECMIHCPTGAITYSGGTPPKMEGAKLDAKDIQDIPLFKGINREFLRRSEGAVAVRTFDKGEVICRQGEFGSSAFYVDSGSVQIYIEGSEAFGHVRTKKEGGLFNRMVSLLLPREKDERKEEGEKRFIPIDAGSVDLSYDQPIATVGEGELIGEAACLNYQPRSATVVAAEDGTIVFEMLRNVLDILRRNREFKRQMEAKYRARALDNHLRSVGVFRDLPKDFIDYLRDRVELVGFNPGEAICRQGEPADAFYLVRMGHVKVYESFADGQGLVLTYLSRSQYFGEIGLLGGGVRTANCSALDHVECVKIGKNEFDEMLAKFPQIRERLQKEATARVD
jgi:CRP-like cAMP-binding protein/NAD-dependent dihydropyrimidine dehydrogenase PreA subunit/ferredoxin